MKILGLNSGEINSSSIILKNGEIIVGLPEERINRIKKTSIFPRKSIEICLQESGMKFNELDFIAQGWNPGATILKYNPVISANRVRREDYFYSLPDNLFQFTERDPGDWVRINFDKNLPPVFFIQHHRCHAANAFFLSEFEDAAILTADWRGELESITKSIGENGNIQLIGKQNFPNSIGLFYATYTELLGYRPDNDEWKVMALSAYQIDCSEYEEKIRSTVHFHKDGCFELDQSFYKGAIIDQPFNYTEKLYELLGSRKGLGSGGTDEWMIKIAKAMQNVAEEIAIHIISDLYEKTQKKNLALAGGFFMNSVLNGKIQKKTKFQNVFIPYAPDDVGNSIGAALYLNNVIMKDKRRPQNRKSSIGPIYTNIDILASLERRKIKFKVLENIFKEIAELLVKGYVIALFQGRMEFGDRALGNRSIIADPRDHKMKDKINEMIKYRESYRPFAPATLYERATQIFEVPDGFSCDYMEKVVMVREEYRSVLGAVTHFDGSGRLQTVKRDWNPYFYSLIQEFDHLTGIPVLLNTSFNVNEEPIVLTPDNAISTFYNSGLDYLVLENILISKD